MTGLSASASEGPSSSSSCCCSPPPPSPSALALSSTAATSPHPVASKRASPSEVSSQSSLVWVGRVAFLVIVLLTSLCLGWVTYRLLSKSEYDVAVQHFEAITTRTLRQAEQTAYQRRQAALAMMSVVQQQRPSKEGWPFVFVDRFEAIATHLLRSSSGADMGFVPLVRVDDLPEWEDFAYDYLHETREPSPFPNTAATSSFGRGVWAIDPTLTTTDQRYHDTTGITTRYNSSYSGRFVTPVFQTDEGVDPLLLFNVHGDEVRGRAIDDMIRCSRRMSRTNSTSTDVQSCGMISRQMQLRKYDGRPGAAILQPIYPTDSPWDFVGFVSTVLLYEEVLDRLFSKTVSGLDCVLSDTDRDGNAQAVTYTITAGTAQLIGETDLHQPKYNSYNRSAVLTDPELYAWESPMYTLTIYPTQTFFEVYQTGNPLYAAVAVAAIITVTTLCSFGIYDYYVRREFQSKQQLLDQKRQFVRYVSHEVRTPLNSVCMGLHLLQTEIAGSLGHVDLTSLLRDDELTQGDDHEDTGRDGKEKLPSWLRLAHDVESNARVSVDILNDLLNYDKIQRGILQYEVAAIPVWSLIYDTVKNEFQLSAARKQQSLHLRYDLDDAPTGIVGMDTPSELPIDMSRLVVIGDDMKLVQVFRNLISNGIKFSPVGSTIHIGASWVRVDGGADGEETTSSPQHREQRWTVRPGRRRKRRPSHDEKHRWVLRHQTVTLSKTKQDIVVVPKGRIRLTIRDEGPGLTKPQLEQIFEENTQFNVNELQGGQGSGLGLYIARGIVNHHKGNIQVSSQGLGHGTTFTITLPLYEQLFEQQDPQEELVGMEGGTSVDTNTTRTESILHTTTASIDEEQGTLPAPPPPPPTAITTSLHLQQPPRQRNERSLNILVVDDSVTNRKLLSRVLTNHGHYCDQASNGLEACEMAISYDYDCILMDYVMPVMDGPAAVSKIRNELRRVVLIVGITGNMLPEDVQHFTSCGANCVLPKPVKFDDLYNVWKSMNLI